MADPADRDIGQLTEDSYLFPMPDVAPEIVTDLAPVTPSASATG
jgi:hypothetical protein